MSDLSLDIEFLINNPAIRDAVRKARLDISGLADGAEKDADRMDKAFSKLSKTLTGVFTAGAVKHFISELIEVRGQFQQIENSLTTILKSQDAANALMTEWKDLTLRSPYTLSEIAQSGKQLLAYGVEAKNVTKNIEQLANVASGVSQPLGDIAYLYGTLKTQGRAYQMDINQFTNRGIPIVAELAKVMKVADSEVRGLVEAGKVGFPEVEKAIANMTGAGGQFFNLIGKQAETLPGQINRLKHEWELMLNEIGTNNEGILAGGIGQLANLVEHYEKVIDIIKVLVITYGSYRAAVILNTVATSGASAAEALHYGLLVLKDKIMTLLTAKTAGLTAATAAYTAVLAALAVVAYAGIQYQTAAEIAEDSLTEARGKGERAAAKEQSRIERLTKVIKDHNSTKEAQISAYEELQSTTSGVIEKYSLEEVASGKADKALASYTSTVKNAVSAETEYAQYKALEEKLKAIEDGGIKAVSTMDRLWVSIKRTFAPSSQGMTTGQWWNELFSGKAASKGIVDNEINKIKDAQGKILNGVNGKGVQKLISGNGKVLTVQEDAEITRAKKYAADLKDVIGNFDKLLSGAKNKSDLEKVKEAITEKINALAPGDAKINEYKAKLQRVMAIEAQYGLSSDKKSAKEAEKWGEKKIALMDKLAQKSAEVSAKGQTQNEKEILDAKRRYTDLRTEFENFNKNAPKGQKIGAGTFTVINDLEKKETGNLQYDQDTEKLKEALQKQKQLYTDFEDYKKIVGDAKAKVRFAGQIDTEKDYLKKLEAEMKTLNGTDLTGVQVKRKEMLVKEIEDEKLYRQRENDKRYTEAYEASKAYQQREFDIKRDYSAKIDALLIAQNGKITKEQRATLDRTKNDAIEAAKTEALAKTDAYKRASEDVFDLSRSQVKAELKALKQLIDDGSITGEGKAKVQKEISNLEFTLKIGVDQAHLESLKFKLKGLQDQLNEKDSNGNSILSDKDVKRITRSIGQISTEIKTLSGDGKNAKSAFSQGLDANLGYLKESSAKVAAGVSSDLSRVSGSFNELSQAFGGTDTQAGYLMGTIGDLTKIGSDAAGSFAAFASGDIVGGVTKAISAVAGLFSMGKKVKEMNAKARKEVEDFYANAISGEKAYQELLKERELQNIRNNKVVLQGIRDEVALRKSLVDQYNKEAAEIMAKLQGQSFVASKTDIHGTWFRKAKVENTYGSLAGKDFQELSNLLAQGKLEGDAKALVERLKELEQKGYDAEKAMADLAKQTAEIFTGTTADSLTDGLLNMFKEGKTGVQDFANFFKSTMDDALLSTFKNKVLANLATKFYDEFTAKAESDDALTDNEITDLQTLFANLTTQAKDRFEEFKKIAGSDFTGTGDKSSSTSLSGAYKAASQESIDLLAGQTGGFRIAQLEGNQQLKANGLTMMQQLQVLKDQYLLQKDIELNTRQTAENTADIKKNMASLANTIIGVYNSLRATGRI